MRQLNQAIAVAELSERTCALNHKHDPCGVPPACNYLVVPMGIKGARSGEHIIPICGTCQDSLTDESSPWVLLYCMTCCESQWIDERISRLSYLNRRTNTSTKILWFTGCPKCSGRLEGLYFS